LKNFCPPLKIAGLLTAEQQLVSQANLPRPAISEAKQKVESGRLSITFLSLAWRKGTCRLPTDFLIPLAGKICSGNETILLIQR
jgi:hypothetical protein